MAQGSKGYKRKQAAWKGLVWAAWCKGERNVTALGESVGKGWLQTRNAIEELSIIAAAADHDIAPDGELIAGLELDLRDLERVYREAMERVVKVDPDTGKEQVIRHPHLNAAVGAKRQVIECRLRIAVAKGLVIDRSELGIQGKVSYVVEQFGEGDHGGGNRGAENGGSNGSGDDADAQGD